jgi:hypothetical protein
MGIAKPFEGSTGLGSAKERFHVLVVGKAEHGGAVTLGVFIPTCCAETANEQRVDRRVCGRLTLRV